MVSKTVKSFGGAQQIRVAELKKRFETSEGQPAASKTALRKNNRRNREDRGGGSENSGEASSWETRRPKASIE